jgi:hypothetical protein
VVTPAKLSIRECARILALLAGQNRLWPAAKDLSSIPHPSTIAASKHLLRASPLRLALRFLSRTSRLPIETNDRALVLSLRPAYLALQRVPSSQFYSFPFLCYSSPARQKVASPGSFTSPRTRPAPDNSDLKFSPSTNHHPLGTHPSAYLCHSHYLARIPFLSQEEDGTHIVYIVYQPTLLRYSLAHRSNAVLRRLACKLLHHRFLIAAIYSRHNLQPFSLPSIFLDINP